MLGVKGNGEGGTTQTEKHLTLSGFALSHSQEVHRHFVHCIHTQWGVSATKDFQHCPYTPAHLHQVISEVHLPWFVWIPPGQIKLPPPPLALQSRAHFHSLIPLPHRRLRVSTHTSTGRGYPVSSSMALFFTTMPRWTWQLQERLKSPKLYRLGRQQKGNSYFKIQITPI